jgi:macrolide transport system ATP-binding/permease protein
MFRSLRNALRMLRNNPGFTFVAIASLAIGIGFTSASFSIADTLLLRPMPVAEPSRVVTVAPANEGAFGTDSTLSYPDYRDFRDHNRTFDGIVASDFASFGFSPNAAAVPKVTYGAFVSGNFFSVLGVQPVLGRAFLESEDQAIGRDAVVVLGHDFWTTQYNADPSAVGSTIRLNGVEFKIIGVVSRAFNGVIQQVNPSLFVPVAMLPRLEAVNALERRDLRWFTVKGRLKPGASISQAGADLGAIAKRLEEQYPQTNRDRGVQVLTELELRVKTAPPNAIMAALELVLGLCVLAVACANVAGLLVSRARVRAREMAVRLAIGAGRGVLIRQLLFENLLLAIAGGLVGMLLAGTIVDFFNGIPIPTDIPISIKASMDNRMLFVTVAVSVLSTLVFGLIPALQTTRVDLVSALKSSAGIAKGRKRLWGRNLMVSAQVALSLVLLVVSAVIWGSFQDQIASGPGFRLDHLFLTSFDTQPIHYSNEQTRKFYRELLDQARSAPGVRSAALASGTPLGFNQSNASVVPEGYSMPPGQQAFTSLSFFVSDGYFATQGVRLLRGRGFVKTDQDGAPLVAVVNAHFAEHYWPKQDAIGKRFHLKDASGRLVQIMGIAETGKYVWIAEPPLDFVYLPSMQYPLSALTLMTESTAPDAATLAPVVRDVVRKIDPSMPIVGTRTMQDFYSQRAVKTMSMIVEMNAGLGLMGLLLALIGLYALVAYSVSLRSREIGIRMAIGADRGGVLRMVLRQGFVLGSIGAGAGLILSFLACRAMMSSLWILAGGVNYALLPAVAVPLLLVTLLAAYVPARRASLIDPMRALRDE